MRWILGMASKKRGRRPPSWRARRDAFAAVPNLQRFAVEALALARFAGDVHVGQEVHFDGAYARAFARLAASSRHIEGEASLFVAADFGLGEEGELRADQIHQSRVRRGIRTRRASDGLWSMAMRPSMCCSPVMVLCGRNADVVVQMVEQRGEQGLVDE